jgi:hypothetical protein
MRTTALVALALLGACEVEEEPEVDPYLTEELVVMSEVWFARAEGTTSVGFDLDGVTSTAGGGTGCGVGDLTTPDGVPGIDNSFAAILPALEAIGAEAIEPLLQAAIDDGELLLMMQLSGLDDRTDDDCVDLEVRRGKGEPTVGGSGRIVPGQTFDVDPEVPASKVTCAALQDGVVRATPLQIGLPLTIFDESLYLDLLGGTVQLTLREDGSVGGMIGAGISTAQLQENLESLDGVESDIINLASSALAVRADLEPGEGGACTQMSVVLEFEAVSAYLFPPSSD